MFAKLKKKIAEEGGASPRPGTARIPRSFSRESITSVGADSGDDIASDSSCPREDLLSQLLRRNDQVRKLEVKLSDYAEQLRSLQKTREKLEIALEKHQDSSMRKLQEQNEAYQISRAKMAEGMTLALNKKDQVTASRKLNSCQASVRILTLKQLQEMKTRSLNLFHRRDEQDELDGFQQQELAKVKHMLLRKEEKLSKVEQELEERSAELHQTKEQLHDSHQRLDNLDKSFQQLQRQIAATDEEREEFLATKRNAEEKISELEKRGKELQDTIQRLSVDLHKTSVELEEKGKTIEHLREKAVSLQKRMEGNYSEDEHLQELLKEKCELEQKLEEMRQNVLAAKTSQTEITSALEAQVLACSARTDSLGKIKHNDSKKQRQKSLGTLSRSGSIYGERKVSQRFGYMTQNGSDDFQHLKETISAEIAKALEETQKQREDLQHELEAEVTALSDQLTPSDSDETEQNGEVAVTDALRLQRDNQDLEQQLLEKNKTIKQLQQRLSELKKTLQKELKMKPEMELPEVRERPCSELSCAVGAATTVINNSDMNDSREINFEYLKHVLLKFMSCRESEAFQLLKAVSMLLNFTLEEENMLKANLEYKMSWFWSKPVPPLGRAPPPWH
uniref:Golgin subfamily A member 1 n=1 Tax=Callorhinchus milii TaxID=7868 RepID=A0A4W3GZZ0_CALMI